MILYFVAIKFPQNISDNITAIKLEISKKYQTNHALKLFPHITLKVPFSLDRELENKLIDLLEIVAGNHSKFEVELSGFGSFEKRKPIFFIQPKPNEAMRNLQQEILNTMKINFPLLISDHDKKFHPHISLAYRDLSELNFKLLKEAYREKNFEAKFLVEEFDLLMHDKKQWNIVTKFNLNLK